MYTRKIYFKIYFLKNAKKPCKLNNRDLNRDWTTQMNDFEMMFVNIYILYRC